MPGKARWGQVWWVDLGLDENKRFVVASENGWNETFSTVIAVRLTTSPNRNPGPGFPLLRNKPPTIAPIGERHAVLGKEFILPVKATDEDSDGKLTYSLGTGAPEGAKIDATSGELRWTPAATMVPGPVKLTVQVADSGLPPMTATQEVTINLGDDLAQFTVLTGIIVREGQKEFWLSDKSNNKRLVLHEGETLRYADVDATVERIEKKFVLLRKDETTWRLDLGENLKSLRKVETPAAPATPKQSG